MKVWFKKSDPTKIVSFGKSVGATNESSFDVAESELLYGHRKEAQEFYDITSGQLVAKSQAAVDAIKARRATDEQTAATEKTNRIAEIESKLTKMTPAQLDAFVSTNVTDMASVKLYLKRLTRIVRHLAKEVSAG